MWENPEKKISYSFHHNLNVSESFDISLYTEFSEHSNRPHDEKFICFIINFTVLSINYYQIIDIGKSNNSQLFHKSFFLLKTHFLGNSTKKSMQAVIQGSLGQGWLGIIFDFMQAERHSQPIKERYFCNQSGSDQSLIDQPLNVKYQLKNLSKRTSMCLQLSRSNCSNCVKVFCFYYIILKGFKCFFTQIADIKM